MKKIYISPEFMLVKLNTCKMLAASVSLDGETTTSGTDGAWTKESTSITGRSVWDDEW